MIEKIIPDRISLTLPTVFGEELTFLEFCGKMRSKLNECIDGVNENTSNIGDVTSKTNENTANIQHNASAISKNESDIVKLNGVVNSVSAQTDENTVNINTVSGKVDKNTADIQQNATAISKNTTDIQKNTSDIQQNTSDISANESSIASLNTAFDALTADFLNKKVESLFAPVILNVDSHEPGADINFSVYVRLGRIDWQGLGCLYAKVNISFSGATDAKTLKINSIQFGTRKAADISSVSTSFTAKTDVINLSISLVGTEDIPAGTSGISVSGINLFDMPDTITNLSSAISLEYIPTGRDILCESLAFTSPAGGEEDSKLLYTFKTSEGCFDIFATAAGISGTSARAYLQTDFTNIISNSKVLAQFLCSGGSYNKDTISTISSSGAALGAAMINYTEYTGGNRLYNARITVRTLKTATGTSNSLKNTGMASLNIPFGEFAYISLTFDMFN